MTTYYPGEFVTSCNFYRRLQPYTPHLVRSFVLRVRLRNPLPRRRHRYFLGGGDDIYTLEIIIKYCYPSAYFRYIINHNYCYIQARLVPVTYLEITLPSKTISAASISSHRSSTKGPQLHASVCSNKVEADKTATITAQRMCVRNAFIAY